VSTLSSSRLRLLATIDERTWRAQVQKWAERAGWEVYFTWTSRHSPAGFPDLVLVRPPRCLFAELKTEIGRLSQRQEVWQLLLAGCPGVESYVWRPHDELEIHRILAAAS
jgi:hypothetical protein